MSHDRQVIRHKVEEVKFGFLSGDEIRAISVKQITSPLTFDALNNPLPGGLYDPALGPSQQRAVCPTCGQDHLSCPGHVGHIELAAEVYHPLLFPILFKLLKTKCFSCHKLRMNSQTCRIYAVKMALCDAGETNMARSLDAEIAGGGAEANTDEGDEDLLPDKAETISAILARRQIADDVIKAIGACKKCQNCGAFSPVLRKDGHTKLFLKPLSDKMQKANNLVAAKMGSAMQAIKDKAAAANQPGNDSDPEPANDSDSDAGSASEGEGRARDKPKDEHDQYVSPLEAQAQMQLLWEKEGHLLSLLFKTSMPPPKLLSAPQPVAGYDPQGFRLFFMKTIAVPPPRFRPPMVMADMVAEHPQNQYLTKNQINCFIDSSKDTSVNAKDAAPGLRQILEKKEGLFRKHMMGKRVNHSCRSVISPDPYIGTTEIGIPERFAKVLCFPQPVAAWNVEHLRTLVENGADFYPGANYIEDAAGKLINLRRQSAVQRKGMAARLLSEPGQKVWRHLQDRDAMLVNRQPTLHKPGIMAHHARILRNPTYQTIRMHYANCNTYNADFDGDEINCHLPQNEVARAEANVLAFTNEQYLVPTDGKPLRGLIQDSVDAGVKLCSKSTWLTREDFQQLMFQITGPGTPIRTPQPAILKPKQLWSGKQVFSCILQHLTAGLPQLNLDAKTKTPAVAFGEQWQEHRVVIREGELLQGVLDKAAFGATEFGLVHSVHELYGADAAGSLLTSLGRVLVTFLQFAGHTCGIEDLTLTQSAEKERRRLIGTIRAKTAEMLAGNDMASQAGALDGFMMSELSGVASDIIKACLPGGQEKPFPSNNFSLMVLTGAKGSMVNHSQVSCGLGQQALEGRRVPIMISGKSLPSFQAFDSNPRANGFITDRFLTGIRPQDYYFHCMAGREGLVDTAVKTSRSGYLQRCLIKHLEELKVEYDGTVRDGDGGVFQFMYGEDGIDATQSKFMSGAKPQLEFMARNYRAIVHKYDLDQGILDKFNVEKAVEAHDAVSYAQGKDDGALFEVGQSVSARRLRKGREDWCRENLRKGWFTATIVKVHASSSDAASPERTKYTLRYAADGMEARKVPLTIKLPTAADTLGASRVPLIQRCSADPVLSTLNVNQDLGAVSERFHARLEAFMAAESHRRGLLSGRRGAAARDDFTVMMWVKYMRSLAAPGEAVGAIAGQSVGEPSTQMTLNTFHLAGHGGANVTLGIPRLREIVMTASRALKTPAATVPLLRGVSRAQGEALARLLTRLPLLELLLNTGGGVTVREKLGKGDTGLWERHYVIALRLFPAKKILKAFSLTFKQLCRAISQTFVPRLLRLVATELRRCGELAAARSKKSAVSKAKAAMKAEEEYEDEDSGDEEGQGTLKFGRKKEQASYGDMDDDEKEMWKAMKGKGGDPLNSDDDGDDASDDGRSRGDGQTTQLDGDEQDGLDFLDLSTGVKNNQMFGRMDFNKASNTVTVTLKFPASVRRLLMVGIAEAAAATSVVRSHGKIGRSFLVEQLIGGENRMALQTEGADFATLWALGPREGGTLLDLPQLASNHIYGMLMSYGVEACRAAITKEIAAVFAVYGIGVDARHLGLIADYMTFYGGYRAMNRIGMKDIASPFLQMSFETTASFLVQAALDSKVEKLKSPSARIVMGQVGDFGTGQFDLMVPVEVA
ncbi:putative DNA-directed RNA polymerase I subunit RPA1 [Tribonema minus]|uniref:DNA-directed RNA polymerase subunit n=1 Tax=Tribonema minus TaxID=303371 RepID=A0A836C8M0_9STRA|nr:putative DNA-directed RNA polymerase I subunit RPA1 [Tribonema minus]